MTRGIHFGIPRIGGDAASTQQIRTMPSWSFLRQSMQLSLRDVRHLAD